MPFGRNDDHIAYRELIGGPPRRDKYTRIGIVLTVIPGIVMGGFVGKKLAHFLEICNLFTPDIVDDD
ncbi:hypothetical protein KR018_002665 [Drosophila ironensis]|nr:hypothetical protein KR018_002665 [Drosophila ironensis]